MGSAEGITNHGFYWGIEIGERFDYHMAIRLPDSNKNKDLDYYVIVDELPSIDENITDIPQITGSSENNWNNLYSFYLMNNTKIASQTNISDDIRRNLYWSAFPVGNWSLINDFFLMPTNNSLFEVQTIDTAVEWGYRLTIVMFGITDTETVRYSKENGALNLYEWNSQQFNESIYFVQITIVLDAMPLFVVIGGTYIGLLIVALVILLRESR